MYIRVKLIQFIDIDLNYNVLTYQKKIPGDCPPERKGLPRLPNSLVRAPPSIGGSADLQIVGGFEAYANEFPFLISLQMKYAYGYYHVCGGSIYNKRFIITAAHCVSG